MMGKLELAAFSRPWSNDVALYLRHHSDGKPFIGRVTFEETVEGAYEPEPSFALSPDMAQRLADELWRAGFRPSQGRQSEGVTEAQGRHLEDMRRLAFAKLNVEQP